MGKKQKEKIASANQTMMQGKVRGGQKVSKFAPHWSEKYRHVLERTREERSRRSLVERPARKLAGHDVVVPPHDPLTHDDTSVPLFTENGKLEAVDCNLAQYQDLLNEY